MKKIFFSSYVLLLALCAIVIVGCANEMEDLHEEAKAAPSNAKATALALATNVVNGGQTGYLYVTGNGTAVAQNFDGVDYTNTNYTVNSNSVLTVHLQKDTTWVEKFGIDVGLITKPQNINTVDTVNAEKVGKLTTMSSWNLPDGQSIQASILNLWDRTANEDAKLPHVITENARFNKLVSVEPSTDGRSAEVTLSLLADVRGENSPSTSGEGTKEVWVSYIQALPEPEVIEPKGPTYDFSLSFSLKNEQLKGTFTVTGSDGLTASYPWTAAKVAKYQGQERLNVASTEAALHEQNVADYPAENSTKTNERDGLQWETEKICKEVFQNRGWMSNGGGILPHPEKVYFYTTSVSVTLPDGRRVTARIEQSTVFRDDVYAKNSSLIGDIYQLPNEDVKYMYNTTCTIVSDHYVTCTVVEDGVEKSFSIDCLEGGLLLHNTGDINLYTK